MSLPQAAKARLAIDVGGTFTDLFKVGETGGFDLVVEQQVSGILGDFQASFSGNTVKGIPAGVIVPEPSTAIVVLSALATLAWWGLLQHLGGRTRP